MNELLRLKLEKLPTCPGCYLMKSEGQIIYVGKAINLKNRVRPVLPEREGPHGESARDGCAH